MEFKRRRRLNTHRWTELETNQLLLEVSKDVQKRTAAFEKPTSEKFYAKIKCRNIYLKHISWTVMKAKMRYMRGIFIAENGKTKQLSPDERHMNDLMGKKCPHYDLLELIFGQREDMRTNCVQSRNDFHTDAEVFSDSKDDDIGEFSDHIESEISRTEKKTRLRLNEAHFWSEEETAVLIKYVLEGISNDPNKFEKPCSRLFYETNCKKGVLEKLEWPLMKSKMRYFRVLYLKAERWLEHVGAELFKSDGKHITTRLNSICPYYNEVKLIFESRLPVDPIKISWDAIGAKLPVHHEQSNDANSSIENSRRSFKIENGINVDDGIMHSDVALVSEDEGGNDVEDDDAYSSDNILTPKLKHDLANFRKTALEFQQEKLKFEKQKFKTECEHRKKQDEFQTLHLEIEKEKLELEKQRLRGQENLKRHEIDQNFILKKLQLERDERIQRIELEKNERLRQIELEYKYKL